MTTTTLASLLLALALPAQDPAPENPSGARTWRPADLEPVRALTRLSDRFAEEVWPGFDLRKVPVAVNVEDRQELLVGHPEPPEGFAPLEDVDVLGRDVSLLEGITRYGPRGGGWAVELGGEQTAYVSVLQEGQELEGYLSLLWHEGFHVFQRSLPVAMPSVYAETPELDAAYGARLALEGRLLHAALTGSAEELEARAREFVAVRHRRRAPLAEGVVNAETFGEFNEGTATYSQARLLELAAEQGGLDLEDEPEGEGENGGEGGAVFADAERRLREMLAGILPPAGMQVLFMHAQYQYGMGLGLVLDRLRPDWKAIMNAEGRGVFPLLEEVLAMDAETEAVLADAAEERFGFAELLAEQTALVDERRAHMLGILEAEGRRFRVVHATIGRGFKWKPAGPVQRVPQGFTPHEHLGQVPLRGGDATIWEGGIAPFEKEGLVFRSESVPVTFRHCCIEWIDPEPAEDGSDWTVQGEAQDDGSFLDLRFRCDGFELTAPAGEVTCEDGVVEIVCRPATR